MLNNTADYFGKFYEILIQTVANSDFAIENIIARLEASIKRGNKIMAIGNGGSAAIAIHTLVDFANAGGLRTVDFMSPAMLTCMANDHGYENVFARPMELFAKEDDILFVISSSGKSPNILRACEAAMFRKCYIVTFSGFNSDNPLRSLGDINFYVPSNHYGFVEIAHQALIHCILDLFVERKNQSSG